MTSAVGDGEPALARQTVSRVTRGFLFADLRGYTAFIEANGDAAAGRLLDEYRRMVRAVVSEYGGAEIKTEGDSFYVVFPSATEAVSCGIAIVNAAAVATKDHADLPIKVAIGVHAGETADTEGGLVGSAVNMAARLCSVAAAGEVLVSDTVRGLTRTGGDFRYIPRGRRRLKGIAEPILVFAAVDASSSSVGRAQRSRFGGGRRPAAIAAVLVATLVIAGVLISPNLTAMLSTANSSPTPTVGVSPSSRPVPTASTRTTPTTSTAPSPVAISELKMGKADPGRYRASLFYHQPEFELGDGWTIGTCPSNGPVHCENGHNNGYDGNLLQFRLSGRPQSQLVLFHPAVFLNEPCGIDARPTTSPSEPFLGWLRTQPGLEIGTGFERDFEHVKTTVMDVNVVDEHACTTQTPHSVALGGGFRPVGGGTYFALNSGSATKAYALTIPNNVVAFLTAPNQDELELLKPEAEAVLDTLSFPDN